MIAEPLSPESKDYVVRSGKQMHKILKDLRKLHLFMWASLPTCAFNTGIMELGP